MAGNVSQIISLVTFDFKIPYMKDLDTNLQALLTGIRNAIGVPALLLFSAMTGFGSLAQEQGLSLYISVLSTILILSLIHI